MILSCEIINRSKFLLERGSHPQDSIIIVLEGSFFCETHNQKYIIGQKEMFFFKNNEPFQRKIISPMTAIYIIFDTLSFESNKKITTLYHTRMTESIHFLINAINKDNAKLTEHFINDILYCCTCSNIKNDLLVCEVMQYIEENYKQSISLDLLASTFNLSKQWLILRFKKEMNITPITYLNHFRMKKAKELLLQQEMLISEVAFACGFETPYYFTNAFKKHFGISPSIWRKNMTL